MIDYLCGSKASGLFLKVAVWGFSSGLSQPVGRPTHCQGSMVAGGHVTTVFAWAVLQLGFKKNSLAQVNWALVCAAQTSTCVPNKKQSFQEAFHVSCSGV